MLCLALQRSSQLETCWIFELAATTTPNSDIDIFVYLQALKEAAFSSVDLLGGPMGLSPGNYQSPNSSSASVSRTRNLSLSPRANKFVQEKLAAKSPVKQDNSPEEIERIKALFQAACTRYMYGAFSLLVHDIIACLRFVYHCRKGWAELVTEDVSRIELHFVTFLKSLFLAFFFCFLATFYLGTSPKT